MTKKKIYIIAGESSGDALGAKLIKALKATGQKLEFHGIGGERMAKEGFDSLFNMSELALMGFLEIIPHIPNLLNRLDQTAQVIKDHQPDLVITIDSPGFCFRLAKKLKGSNIKMLHYVAPTVWAYKPERAQKVADLYDHLLLLLPFEPPYFDEVNLPNTYIGHPIVEEEINKGNGEAFRETHLIPAGATLLCALPGSRHTEVARLLPIYTETIHLLSSKIPDLHVVIPTVSTIAEKVRKAVEAFPVPVVVVDTPQEKYDAYAASNVALVKSGTGALEVSMAGLASVVAYKVNPLSYWYIKRLLNVQYVNLVNLIVSREAIPELIQEDCTAQNLAQHLEVLLKDPEARKDQNIQAQQALEQLGVGQTPLPSEKAAAVVLEMI